MANITAHQTRRALALIDDADRCSDTCPGWIVSESNEHGWQIERCDECNGTGCVRDEDVQQLPEAQAMLRDVLAARAAATRHDCRCSKCGGFNVEYTVWFNPNTGDVGELFGSWNYGDNTFCSDCDGNTDLVDKGAEPELWKALDRKYRRKKGRAMPRSDLDVQTMLVASTGHLREETAKRIEADIAAHPKTAGTEMWSPQLSWEYGWIWHVRKIDDAEIRAEEWPPELAALINFAHEQGVTWLRLDCDAEKISGLPTWEW